MISVEEALQRVLGAVPPIAQRHVSISGAGGRYLAEDVEATHSSPPFDTSAMDGFAVRAADLAAASENSPVRLPHAGEVRAGESRSFRLESNSALRINTGAPLPEGADAVVRIEDVNLQEDAVTFVSPVAPGNNLRRRGEDFVEGARLLQAGRRLDAAAIGVLASMGRRSVCVARRPRVALFSTGDEIVEPGEPLPYGSIYNSSRYALAPLLEGFGAEIHDFGRIPDDEASTKRALGDALGFDLIVTTGGVSMGSRDFVRPVLLDLGVEEVFWKVKQRPGKPLFFGKKDACLIFGLPGNPVSVFVTALVYVRVAILKSQGALAVELPWTPVEAGAEFRKNAGLTVFARANLSSDAGPSALPRVVPSPAQGSHQFSGLAASDGLVRLEESWDDVGKGRSLQFLRLSAF